MMSNHKYTNYVFDFDGVLVNSNILKRDCFLKVADLYGTQIYKKFKQYCDKHPSATRYEKMQWLEKKLETVNVSHKDLINQYSYCVKSRLLEAESVTNLPKLQKYTQNSSWSIVSAAPEEELRWFLKEKNWNGLFEGGVYGAPRSKDSIFRKEYSTENRKNRTVFFGDSKSDFEVARKLDIDFVFVNQWARDPELKDVDDIVSIESIRDYFR